MRGGKGMTKTKQALVALVAASVTEASLFALFDRFGHIGGDGPDTMGAIGLILHFPGVIVADRLHLTGAVDTIFITFTGFLQFFLFFWFVIAIWHRIGHHSETP